MGGLVGTYLLMKFVDMLTRPWDQLPAFKYGIIDKNGKILKRMVDLKTSNERNAFGLLEKFVFNLRRLIEMLPGGKTSLAKYVLAYQLFKEEAEPVSADCLFEQTFVKKPLKSGKYRFLREIHGDKGLVLRQGELFVVNEDVLPFELLGEDVYNIQTEKGHFLISNEDVQNIA